MFVQASALVRPRYDTLQVLPCKLIDAIHGDTTVGTTLHPSPSPKLRSG